MAGPNELTTKINIDDAEATQKINNLGALLQANMSHPAFQGSNTNATAGGVSSTAAGAANKTGSSVSSGRTPNNPGPGGGRIPGHTTSGSLSSYGLGNPIPASQVNRIYSAMQGKSGGQQNTSDSGIRQWINGAPGSGGGGGGILPPAVSNILNDPGSYNFGSAGYMMAVRNQIVAGLPGWGSRFTRGAAAVAGETLGQYAQLRTNVNLTGREDMGGNANLIGSAIGGIVGAGIGAISSGPFGTYLGAGIGGRAGGQIADYVISRDIATVKRQELVMPAAVTSGGLRGDYGHFENVTRNLPNPTSGPGSGASVYHSTEREWQNPALASSFAMSERARKRSASLGERYWTPSGSGEKGDYTQYHMSAEQMAKSYSTVYGALIESGINPEQMVSSGLDRHTTLGHIGDDAMKKAQAIMDNPKSTLTQKRAATAQAFIGAAMNYKDRDIQDTKDPLYAMLVERGAIRWGKAGEQIIDKAIAPIIGTINQTGNNTADILMKYGVGATNSWIEDTTEIGKTPRVSLPELMKVQSTMQKSGRSLQFSQLAVRNRGGSAADLLGFQQDTIASIPGGDKSLTYAQLGEQKRMAGFQRDREQDIMSYDMPMAALEGAEQRRQFLPNMPGYGLKLSMERLSMRSPYIAQRQKRYAAQVAGGQLTEEEQLQQFQQIQSLQTEQAHDIGMLAEGGANRMLAFSGGRPSFFSRMDSIGLARTAFARSGSPQIGSGANNGAQLKYQNDFFRQFASPGFDPLHAMAPHATSGYQNSPLAPTGRTEGLLKSILDALKAIQNGNGGTTPMKHNPAGGVSTNSMYGNQHANQQASVLNPSFRYGRGQA